MAADPDDDVDQNATSNDFDPETDFGADGASSSNKSDGGQHHTVWSNGGYRYSWDTDSNGNLVDGSEHTNTNNQGG